MALLLFLIIVSALILGKSNFIENVLLAAAGSFAIAVLLSLIAFVGAAGTAERRSISGILRTVRFGGQDDEDQLYNADLDDITTDAVSSESEQSSVAETVDGQKMNMADEDAKNLLRKEIDAKLSGIVEGEELYLKRDLTLTSVADRLGIFREELADYIEYRYGMSFQNYINMLRVNYAQKYILSHDGITQKEIAMACGFSGASSFNSAFSKQTGVTPKIWKDRQLESQKNREA